MTGLLPESISCNLKIFEPGRKLDDYGHAVIRFENGALGTVTASQISHGRENDLFIEIDGTKGALQWRQEEPNQMIVRRNGHPHAIYTRDPERAIHERIGQGRLPASRRPPRGFFRSLCQHLSGCLRQHGATRREQEVRDHGHGLSERQRRRRGDVFHPAIGRQQRRQRGLAAAETCAGKEVSPRILFVAE